MVGGSQMDGGVEYGGACLLNGERRVVVRGAVLGGVVAWGCPVSRPVKRGRGQCRPARQQAGPPRHVLPPHVCMHLHCHHIIIVLRNLLLLFDHHLYCLILRQD